MQDEKRKQYMKEYNRKKLKHLRQYKKEWQRRKIELDKTDSLEVLSNTAGHTGVGFVKGTKFTLKKNKCARCEKLFTYGGAGDGINCDECLDELKYGQSSYFSQIPGLYQVE